MKEREKGKERTRLGQRKNRIVRELVNETMFGFGELVLICEVPRSIDRKESFLLRQINRNLYGKSVYKVSNGIEQDLAR